MFEIGLIALVFATFAQDEGSVLTNGDFETVASHGLPEGWMPTLYPDAAHFALDEEIVHAGERSAFVEVMPGRRIGRFYFNWFQRLSLTPGERYVLGGFVRCEADDDRAFVIVQFWANPSSRDQRLLGVSRASAGEPLCVTEDWTKVEAIVDVPEGTTSVYIRVGLMSMSDGGHTDFGGKAWFDDISITPSVR